MNQRALMIAAALFALVVAAMFGYSYVKKSELESPAPVFVGTPEESGEEVLVNAVHFFKDGQHTVVGEVVMPTPCHLIQSDVSVAESMPEQVTIALLVVNNADTCAQILTPQQFRADFSASQGASISLTIDGKRAKLNLRDAAEGEKPEDIGEFYFKG